MLPFGSLFHRRLISQFPEAKPQLYKDKEHLLL